MVARKTRLEKWNAAVEVLVALYESAQEQIDKMDDKESEMTDSQSDDYDDCEQITALDPSELML